jgi:hypothetical protein
VSRTVRLSVACAALLSVLAVLLGARIAKHFSGAAIEFGSTQLGEPSPALRERLARLDSELLLSWYGSSKDRMPSQMRDIEDGVMRCLRGIEAVGGGRVRVQRIDPESDPALAAYCATFGIGPFRARRVERDSYTEESVWSSVRIAYGAHGASTIARVSESELPHLQELIAAHLDELSAPRRPRIALSAPRGYGALRRALAARGELREIDLDADLGPETELLGDADVCFWIDPKNADANHLSALERFLAEGQSLVIAGSRHTAQFESSGAGQTVRFTRTGCPMDALGAHFGLRTQGGLALDARSDEGGTAAGRETPTFLVRAIAPNQDFRTMSSQPNGSLWFAAPTIFEPDAQRLAELDLGCTVLATSSESTWTRPDTDEPLAIAELQPQLGQTNFLGARPLLAILRPVDPWRGSLVFAAASTPFQDEFFLREAAAHEPLVDILVATLASSDRRAAQRVAIAMPTRLHELSASDRAFWRALVVFGLPVLVTAGWIIVRFAGRRVRSSRPMARAIGIPAVVAILLVCVLARLMPAQASFDWTRGQVHELAQATEHVLSRANTGGPITIEFVFSAPSRLPPELRPRVRDARELVLRMQRASTGLAVDWLEPEVGNSADEARFAARGIAPARATSRADETTIVRRLFGAIAISRGNAREIVTLVDADAFDELEFKLAAAIERLRAGRRARIAFASDVPRPSPAESLTRYQRKGLFAPGEGDVYSEARDWLASHGFDVVYVDPRDPTLPADMDLLVWLQPRREVAPLLCRVADYLARGGKVLLAAQHYQVRSRQKQDRSLELSLWPEPQFPDLDRLYFANLGIRFPREVLFDATAGTVDIATEVERDTGARATLREGAASPLLIRALAAGFDPESPITRGLGDQLFLFGNRIAWDPATLASHGLRAEALVSSSDRTWALEWTGGDLPPEVLQGPPSEHYLGRQTLAARFEGRFPPAKSDPELGASDATDTASSSGDRSGELVWIGCSEMFKNGRLHLAGFDHAELLLRSASHLALGDELTSIVARESREHGFDPVTARVRTMWRAIVLAGAPVLLVLLGIVFVAWRAHLPRRERAQLVAS